MFSATFRDGEHGRVRKIARFFHGIAFPKNWFFGRACFGSFSTLKIFLVSVVSCLVTTCFWTVVACGLGCCPWLLVRFFAARLGLFYLLVVCFWIDFPDEWWTFPKFFVVFWYWSPRLVWRCLSALLPLTF